ncbi:MAG TPA: EAL domain-containing protein [Gammaproteobacteria bacterium]|nr:EAL domain-containing protein [Gammaproteobacteria bacterium]MCP5435847.1 EAL domain-containing protein [Chromatiaceae bacterium]MCW5587751.1 EAL domain-containing protein [Chromatiales bacterium]HPQ26198.1 EAL domain-containing protein [Gammaproteobacteria bacterium]
MDEPNTPSPERGGHLPSYRTRYALIVGSVAVLLAIVALLTYRYIVTVSTQAAAEAGQREASIVVLNDGFGELYQVRQALHDFLLTPAGDRQRRLEVALKRLDSAFSRLAEDSASGPSLDNAMITLALRDDAREFIVHVGQLIDIRLDPSAWFPAAKTIDSSMQTNNSLFTAHVDALIESIRISDDAANATILLPLYELQKAWLRMIDEVRLVIANRFGVFASDPLAGIQTRAGNVQMYSDRVDRLLGTIGQLTENDPVVQYETSALAGYAAAWQAGYADLLARLNNSDWRTDIKYLHSEIDPHLRRIEQRLDMLRIELQTQARRQVDSLTGISRRLGGVLFGSLGLLLFLGVAGYLSFDRLILRAIRNLGDSLKAHAHDPLGVLPSNPVVSETRDLISAFTDMQAQVRERELELDHLAHHDTLTGLPNRALFRRHLTTAIEAAGRHEMLVGLLFMDLDRFKQINDSYGHAVGDQLLVEISSRLLKVFRQEDMVARLGGDEFAILLENLHERSEMTQLAEKALRAIQRPYECGGHIFYSGASIGIAVAPHDSVEADRLIQLADAAMYAAKRDSGSSLRFVDAELTADAAAQHALENELREAVRQHQLELHFQPVVAMIDGRIHSYESLLRWPHAQQGMLRPASFMDALADAGLCSTISDWVLDQLQTKRPSDDAVLSINLSARLLHDESFAQRLFDRIDAGSLTPTQLIIEITEDTLETDLTAAARVLHELKNRGVRIALDDFGTGQASLSHLRRFPFDYIKVDQSFIAGIGKVVNDEKLVQAIIRLAHALGMAVVAEGVETQAQRDFLAAEQCDYLQGYLVGVPAAGSESR